MSEKLSLDFRSFQLERYMAKYEFTMKYPFSCSDPTSYTIDEIFSLTSDSLKCYKELGQINLCYTEAQGDPELRQLISQYIYNNQIESDKIIVHSGAEEAIFTFFTSFLKTNDDVIVLSPCYQSLYEIPRACGCNVRVWNLIDNNGKWQLDFQALQELITPQTKLIIINTPHNPTGFHLNQEEQKYIIEIANQNGIYIFADEVYRYTEQNPNHTLQSFCTLYDKSIALGVTSKSMSLAGLRIGWICSQNQEILDKISKQKDYTTICNSAPSEFIAKIAIQNSNQIFKRNLIIFHNQLLLINHFMDEFKSYLQWNSPTSCTIGFAKIIWENFPSRLRTLEGTPSDIFCQDILEKAGILLIPGTQFDFIQSGKYDNYFRLSFCRVNTQEILEVFKIYMKQWIIKKQDDLQQI